MQKINSQWGGSMKVKYYKNGTIKEIVEVNDEGKPHGVTQKYSPDGQIKKVIVFENGKKFNSTNKNQKLFSGLRWGALAVSVLALAFVFKGTLLKDKKSEVVVMPVPRVVAELPKIIDLKSYIKEQKVEIVTQSSIAAAKKPASRSAVQSRKATNAAGRVFKATAYDLSYDSCQKNVGHPYYGVTRSGYNLSGLTRQEAMTIAVDPRIIPLGSKVRLTFVDKAYSKYNGVYTARDTGGGVKGSHIDLFMGDFRQSSTHPSVDAFGVRKVKIEIVK